MVGVLLKIAWILGHSYTSGFPWSELAPNSTVVDVGGGVGAVVYELMQEHPTLQYIVQDLPPTIADAHKVCRSAGD